MLEDQMLKRLFGWITRKKQLLGHFKEKDFGDYADACVFNWTYLPVLDKTKDYQVDKMAIENNLASYTEIFAEKGKDFAEEAKQIAEDKNLINQLLNIPNETEPTEK